MDDIIGHVVMCEDNVFRRVITITDPVNPALAKSGLFIINENDPGSKMGYYVHALTISCVLKSLPPPSKEAKEAASRLWRGMVIANAADLHKQQQSGELKKKLDFND